MIEFETQQLEIIPIKEKIVIQIVGDDIATNTITNTQISNVNVNKLDGGNIKDIGYIQSSNFVTGISGYKISGDGSVEFSDGIFRGVLSAATIDIGGSDDSSFHIDITGNLWLGAANFNIATNPFVVSSAGVLRAGSGTIGGWTLGASTLASAYSEIVLDSSNKRIEVGTDDAIILDGTNKRIDVGTANKIFIDGANKRIQSDNYVSGYAGAGFHLSDNLLEVGNIACRGLIRTAVFQKDVISVMGGNFAVLDGDVLDADMTALDASTLTIKGITTFAVGDILRIKDGTDDEWLEIALGGGIIDNYNESNQNNDFSLINSTNWQEFGQTFTNIASNTLSSCKFYIKKFGSPTGTATMIIYEHTGTYGVDGLPTGAILATSDSIDVSVLTTSHQLITFNFSGANKITLDANTYYCIAINGRSIIGDGSNYIVAGLDNSSPSHSGNSFYYNAGGYTANDAYDAIFYVYATNLNSYKITRDKVAAYSADSNPTWKKGATVVNYKQSGDGGVYMTASDTNAPYLSVFSHSGSPWTDLATKLRIGNLNGYLGYAADNYGIGIGSSAGTDANLVFDPTNGIRIRNGTTDKITLDNSGNVIFSGIVNNSHSKKLKLKVNNSYKIEATKDGYADYSGSQTIYSKDQLIKITFKELVKKGVLKIQVIDSDNLKIIPLATATVSYELNGTTVTDTQSTDASDNYNITLQLPKNKDVELTVSADKYQDFTQKIKLNNDTENKTVKLVVNKGALKGQSKVTFVVTDTQGNMLDDAQVDVYNSAKQHIGSDKTINGRVLFTISSGETISFRVAKDGFKTYVNDDNVSYKILNLNQTIPIILEAGGNKLDVKVTDKDSFMTLDQATVSVYNLSNNFIDTNVTQLDGIVHFKGLENNSTVIVSACKDTFFCEVQKVDLSKVNEVNLKLDKIKITNSAMLDVFVVDSKSLPIDSAKVNLFMSDTNNNNLPYGDTLVTDATGSISIPLRINQDYMVTIQVGDYTDYKYITINGISSNKLIFEGDTEEGNSWSRRRIIFCADESDNDNQILRGQAIASPYWGDRETKQKIEKELSSILDIDREIVKEALGWKMKSRFTNMKGRSEEHTSELQSH